MSRILVTGGAGFIGSHLVDVLLNQGNEVLCVDNLFTGSKDNISIHANNPKFEFIRHDITEPILVYLHFLQLLYLHLEYQFQILKLLYKLIHLFPH